MSPKLNWNAKLFDSIQDSKKSCFSISSDVFFNDTHGFLLINSLNLFADFLSLNFIDSQLQICILLYLFAFV